MFSSLWPRLHNGNSFYAYYTTNMRISIQVLFTLLSGIFLDSGYPKSVTSLPITSLIRIHTGSAHLSEIERVSGSFHNRENLSRRQLSPAGIIFTVTAACIFVILTYLGVLIRRG